MERNELDKMNEKEITGTRISMFKTVTYTPPVNYEANDETQHRIESVAASNRA